MDEIFGIPTTNLTYVLSTIVITALSLLGILALRNTVIFKLGVRPIFRRPAQTILIIIGVMLSSVIMSAAFGTGDTLNFSIRNQAITGLQYIDELIIPVKMGTTDTFGSTYIDQKSLTELISVLSEIDDIDGIMPQIAENVPTQNVRTSLSEGQMNLVGINPDMTDGFGELKLVDGSLASVQTLDSDEIYISTSAMEQLDGLIGDELDVFINDQVHRFTIRGELQRGGFAGIDPTIIMSISRANTLFDRIGEANTVVISNVGDEISGDQLTEEVTKYLRTLFNNTVIAQELKTLFDSPKIIEIIETKSKEKNIDQKLLDQLNIFLDDVSDAKLSDELNSLFADNKYMQVILKEVEDAGEVSVSSEAYTLISQLSEYRVIKVKSDLLESAEEAGEGVTRFFILFSSFSITVGILLIFLIFVMLAAARKSEMGMARAVGAKRQHLVLMFIFEGTAYAVVSAAIGVIIGLLVSILMVTVLNNIFSNIEDNFSLAVHFELRSIIVAYCLGITITLATVAVSAYRVSRLNIVVAIRGLPETILPKHQRSFKQNVIELLHTLLIPILGLRQTILLLAKFHIRDAVKSLFKTLIMLVFLWYVMIFISIVKFIWPYIVRGWLVALGGVTLVYMSVNQWERASWFGAGMSLCILGICLIIRSVIERYRLRSDVADRLCFTLSGLLILAFWALPFSFYESFVGVLEGGFDIMFVSGIAMVGASVWTVMYNADILIKLLPLLTSKFGKMRPVLVTAIAYPMSSKFRTGLTLAMFALVIFTLVIMSVLTVAFTTQFEEPRKVYMGFDFGGEVNVKTPIENINRSIDEQNSFGLSNFDSIASYTDLRVQLRKENADAGKWFSRRLMLVDEHFLDEAEIDLKIIAEGYGKTTKDVLEAMKDDPSLALAGGWILPNESDLTLEPDEARLFGKTLHYESRNMDLSRLDIREPITNTDLSIKVIGIYDRLHSGSGRLLVSKTLFDDVFPFPIPITNYRFRLAGASEIKEISRAVEVAFIENGMETEVFKETLDERNASGKAFFRLFTGFMALGLLVGVAALGVISTRAVVERRQQIGVLRAIGYKRSMIAAAFLIESSFISVFGSIIGLTLGLVLSYNAVNDIRSEIGLGIEYTVPWIQIGSILAISYAFSLLTTFVPARQASRIYPAEALRYE